MAMYDKKSVEDLDVAGKRVIVRVDFNVPLDKETGTKITDDKRIKGALPTIKYLVDNKAKVILVSHLGRPKNGPEAKFSMKPAADRLAELLGQPVTLAADVIGEDAKAKAAALKEGEVLMLENVRFHKEETKNDPKFAAELASMADLYVNDAFGTAHRAHASTAGLANFLPSACGYLIKKEIDFIGGALDNPARPFVAILGGAKVSDKIGVITNLLDKADTIIIGGGMAYTFIGAQGGKIGDSLFEADKVDLAKEILAKAEEKGVKLLLPTDTVVADAFLRQLSGMALQAFSSSRSSQLVQRLSLRQSLMQTAHRSSAAATPQLLSRSSAMLIRFLTSPQAAALLSSTSRVRFSPVSTASTTRRQAESLLQATGR